MQPITRAYVASANLVRDRIETAREDERGVSVLEYTGLLVIIAAVIAAVASMDLGGTVTDAISGAIQQITGGGN